ncbi:hypothetical protein OIU84_010585 [Salix udensis]|uniref:Uncharacterized protein n=1 Tax=Salix udensis TaxID=889485 RepID=A0AAD6JN54_9ROSI|nr:hypothetical protein OIU84_010585 [Salix udensis]
MMDWLLTLGIDCSEVIARMKGNIYRLIDIYYDALDAPKKGGRRNLHMALKVEVVALKMVDEFSKTSFFHLII